MKVNYLTIKILLIAHFILPTCFSEMPSHTQMPTHGQRIMIKHNGSYLASDFGAQKYIFTDMQNATKFAAIQQGDGPWMSFQNIDNPSSFLGHPKIITVQQLTDAPRFFLWDRGLNKHSLRAIDWLRIIKKNSRVNKIYSRQFASFFQFVDLNGIVLNKLPKSGKLVKIKDPISNMFFTTKQTTTKQGKQRAHFYVTADIANATLFKAIQLTNLRSDEFVFKIHQKKLYLAPSGVVTTRSKASKAPGFVIESVPNSNFFTLQGRSYLAQRKKKLKLTYNPSRASRFTLEPIQVQPTQPIQPVIQPTKPPVGVIPQPTTPTPPRVAVQEPPVKVLTGQQPPVYTPAVPQPPTQTQPPTQPTPGTTPEHPGITAPIPPPTPQQIRPGKVPRTVRLTPELTAPVAPQPVTEPQIQPHTLTP